MFSAGVEFGGSLREVVSWSFVPGASLNRPILILGESPNTYIG